MQRSQGCTWNWPDDGTACDLLSIIRCTGTLAQDVSRSKRINNDNIHLLGYVYIHSARIAATALQAIAQMPSPIVQNAINNKQTTK
jgi:hypothetical protein